MFRQSYVFHPRNRGLYLFNSAIIVDSVLGVFVSCKVLPVFEDQISFPLFHTPGPPPRSMALIFVRFV